MAYIQSLGRARQLSGFDRQALASASARDTGHGDAGRAFSQSTSSAVPIAMIGDTASGHPFCMLRPIRRTYRKK